MGATDDVSQTDPEGAVSGSEDDIDAQLDRCMARIETIIQRNQAALDRFDDGF